jgi:hypothetical protein
MDEDENARARRIATEHAALASLVDECRRWGLDAEQVERLASDLPGEYVATLAQDAAA